MDFKTRVRFMDQVCELSGACGVPHPGNVLYIESEKVFWDRGTDVKGLEGCINNLNSVRCMALN